MFSTSPLIWSISYFLSYKEWHNLDEILQSDDFSSPPLIWSISYFLSYKEWHNLDEIFGRAIFHFVE